MSSGEDNAAGDGNRKKKKRYHRHTPRQIQELEAMFRLCPHPDEKQRMQLSRDLGLEPKQIKFWFQNRRTQMKAQHERQDNCSLRSENDRIRCENIAMREALRNIMCPNCGPAPAAEDYYFDEQKLRMENARLKAELDRVSSITSKHLGRPMAELPPIQPLSMSSLDLSVGGYANAGLGPSSLDLDFLSGTSSGIQYPLPPPPLSDIEKPIMAGIATNAMDELIRLVQTEEPLWIKQGTELREVLHFETYNRIFPKPRDQFMSPDIRIEASRGSGLVAISPVALVDMFMDARKWMELFPTIVSKARTIEVLTTGIPGRSLALMYGEFQILSPVVPTRGFTFLRCCQQIEQGLWAVADVSVDFPRDISQLGSAQSRARRFPSGCLIQDMPNGYSKVSWVEHMEIEEKNPVNRLYHDLVHSGMAFGAQRWVATLRRMCERQAAAGANIDPGGVMPTPEGKRSMMKLSQRMVNSFCSSLSSSNGHQWATLAGLNEVGVRVTVHKSQDSGQPNGVVLSAATSIWLPISCQRVFSFLKDERTRAQWDVLSNGNAVQEVTRITNGSHPGNSISLLRAITPGDNGMLILQESCTDDSGSLVVYAPVDLPAINIAMSGEDTSYIPLLPSGFTVLPDRRNAVGSGASSSSNPTTSGSLLTVTFQILVSSLPSAKLNSESINTVNGLISSTVQHIKAALNCP